MEYSFPVPSIIGLSMFIFGGNAIIFSILGLFMGGKIDVKKLQPICFDPVAHTYIALGERVGKAFSEGKNLKNS
jgi:hypothetical protein